VSVPRQLVVAALDALSVGSLAEAEAILLDALDSPPVPAPVCEVGGARAWPGDFGRHIRVAHEAARLGTAA
jgi:hypothetical protein